MRIYLSNDLSAAGIDSIRDVVERIDSRTAPLRSRLDAVVAAIAHAAPGFSPAKPEGGPAAVPPVAPRKDASGRGGG